jgi:hypothetical protein
MFSTVADTKPHSPASNSSPDEKQYNECNNPSRLEPNLFVLLFINPLTDKHIKFSGRFNKEILTSGLLKKLF